MATEEEKCLRCNEPYAKFYIGDKEQTDYQSHVCSFDKERQEIIDTGIIGNNTIEIQEYRDFRDDYRHLFRYAALGDSDNKKFFIGMNLESWVYHKDKLVYHGQNSLQAILKYNEIKLSVS